DTVGALKGGLAGAMPGPRTAYGASLAQPAPAGPAGDSQVDAALPRVLHLAPRAAALPAPPPPAAAPPGWRPTGGSTPAPGTSGSSRRS
ncbi:hypothetical protein PV408_29535, partial [Streptomyces sp. ME18-1-4]|nr:hypothetical protein [Streptomyces sp. ME18-1-4]